MKLSRGLNVLLSPLNLVVSRKTTINKVISELDELKAKYQPKLNSRQNLLNSDLIKIITEESSEKLRREILRHQISTKWEVVDFLIRATYKDEKNRLCELCGHEDLSESFAKIETHCKFGGGILVRYQCPNCDVIFGPDKMLELSSAELSQEYEWHYSVYEEGDSTDQELRAFHLLKPRKDGVYLNYGAGAWSKSVQLLRSQGWQVFAFEPHMSASTNADYVISDRAILSQMSFDGIFTNNVLEHLRYPIAEITYIRNLLKQGALMAHATPCYQYLYEYTRFHLFFFLGRSKIFLAQKCGLTVKDFISDGDFMCCLMEPV